MAKNVTLQDDEKFCIFVTKDKRQSIILTMFYIDYLQVLTPKMFGISYPCLEYLKYFKD